MDQRVRVLKEGTIRREQGKGPVVFWMNRDQRAKDHWGLLYAREKARELDTFLLVLFCMVPEYISASPGHYRFMLSGLRETANELENRGIPFHLVRESPEKFIPAFLHEWNVPLLVTDFNPLTIKKRWESQIIGQINSAFHQVDSHNIVPCWEASQKLEYAAYTFRPRISKKLPAYLTDFPELDPQKSPSGWVDTTRWPEKDELSDSEAIRKWFPLPGESNALSRLSEFLEDTLSKYGTERNDPMKASVSGLSPYLHFGQISAQRVALETMKKAVVNESRDAFLEELIVRRELSDNFCHYQPQYDQTACFPQWAQNTLNDHAGDQRDYLYTKSELESAVTHDDLWNAAQQRMMLTGSLHGYLRMYWAKKIMEWTPNAVVAQQTAVYLNDRYFLDGRDPNGYAGIAWSIGGVHDRAWPERKVFGKIRYMNEKGCRRKFNVDAFIEQTAEWVKLSHKTEF